MAVSYVITGNTVTLTNTAYIVTSNNHWWEDTPFDPSWEESYKQKIKIQANKCSVQEPPRKKNLRYLNRPA